MAITLQKIERESVTEKAVALLRQKILAGDLPAGTRLIESEVAEQLGTSRAPVREAFLILQPEGLVVSESTRGTFVAEISAEDVREISMLRCVLEGLAVRLYGQRITAESLAELHALAHNMQEAAACRDMEMMLDLHLRFHERIWQLSGQKRLCETLQRMIGPIRLFLALNSQVLNDLVDAALGHFKLLDALSRRDIKSAEYMMVEDIRVAEAKIVAYLGGLKRQAWPAGDCADGYVAETNKEIKHAH
jgi:DNA-binding GntR family transcriptional regulator